MSIHQHPKLTRPRLLLTVAVAVGSGVVVAAEPTIAVRPVAVTGEAAPGTERGVYFSSFTTGLNHSIMHPVIDDAGRVAIIALVDGPDVTEFNVEGLWSESASGGPLGLDVRIGTPAPGAGDGVTFLGVPSIYLPFPPSFAAGRIAFNGELAGPDVDFSNRFGVWAENGSGEIELVLRSGDPAPGFDAGATVDTSTFLRGIAESGTVIVSGGANGPGITNENDEAVWSTRTGRLLPALREGDPAPDLAPGVVIGRGIFGTPSTFPEITLSDTGHVSIAANLLGAGVDAFSDEALFTEDPDTGDMRLIVRESDPAPGLDDGVTFGGGSTQTNFRGLQVNDLGTVIFRARLGGAVPTSSSLWAWRNGQLELLAAEAEPVPGGESNFTLFGNAVVNDDDHIAFTYWLPDQSQAVLSDMFGAFAPVLEPGDLTSDGQVMQTIGTLYGLSDDGVLAFTAGLDDDVFATLMLGTPGSVILPVVRVGDVVDVFGDGEDLRTVIRIIVGGFGDGGHLAYRLDFDDDSSAHFVATLAPIPGDLDGDGDVGAADLAILLGAWGVCGDCAADLDGDGMVDAADLAILLANWG